MARSASRHGHGLTCARTSFNSAAVKEVEQMVAGFESTDLESLSALSLLDRYDTKFVFHWSLLRHVLGSLCRDYAVLSIGGIRAFSYETLYFDTLDCLFYRQHHDQRVNRFKVRLRHYLDAGQCYMEVKRKTNKKKTIKTRMRLDDDPVHPRMPAACRDFVGICLGRERRHIIDALSPNLRVNYSRVTLASPANGERLTLDIGLTFADPSRRVVLDHLVIAEIKHAGRLVKSRVFSILKQLDIHPVTFSKYCMGVVLTGRHPKINRFKEQVRLIEKLSKNPMNKEVCSCRSNILNNTLC